MKKLVVFLSLTLGLVIAFARPPVEGDVLNNNEFVGEVDVSAISMGITGGAQAPLLYGGLNLNGQYISYPSYVTDKTHSDQMDVNVGLNLRYGFLDFFEIFGNVNGYYQHSNPKFVDSHTNTMNFAGANIGLMVALYKGETFHILIGDNSDIVNNAIFDNSTSNMQLFKGHTFFLNLIRQKDEGEKFTSVVTQVYYRMNLKQSYKDFSFKNGDEVGAKFLLQFGKENKLGFIGASVAFRDTDTFNGTRLGDAKGFGSSIGVGFTTGAKIDLNKHLGFKISADIMSYSQDYNASYGGITLGLYFK